MAACQSSLLELNCALNQRHDWNAHACADSEVYMTGRPQQLVGTAAKSDDSVEERSTAEVNVQKAGDAQCNLTFCDKLQPVKLTTLMLAALQSWATAVVVGPNVTVF